MADKPKLKYQVVTGKSPKSEGETIMRPQIVDRETFYVDQVINRALESGYIRGQFEDCKGAVNGFLEACKALCKEGKAVNIANWFRIHAELRGTVGEDRQLTEANSLKVNFTALTSMKMSKDAFSWTNVGDESALAKITSISSPDGKIWEIIKSKAFLAGGTNLVFRTAWGDSVTATYEGLETPLALTPSEQSANYLRFDWPTALADVEAGTEITLVFKLHGKEGGAEQTITKVVTLVAAA